jgi:hypothetical protein
VKGVGLGVLFLILSPIIFLIYTLFIRVYLEIIIVVFRIAENVQKIASIKMGDVPGSPAVGSGPAGGYTPPQHPSPQPPSSQP